MVADGKASEDSNVPKSCSLKYFRFLELQESKKHGVSDVLC